MFTDEHRYGTCKEIRQQDIRAFAHLLTPELVVQAGILCGRALVRSPLCIVSLVWLSVSCALHPHDSFTAVLISTLRILEDQACFASSPLGQKQRNGRRRDQRRLTENKHDPRRGDPTTVSEEAFTQARSKLSAQFWIELILLLSEAFVAKHQASVCFRGFRLLAMDGTLIDLPNWGPVRQHYGTAQNGIAACKAQARLVLMHFPLTRVPYRYVVSPLSTGEIPLGRSLASALEKDDLLLLDAGYWSYGLFWDIQKQGAFFALRRTQKATLRTVRKFGLNDRLVRWSPQNMWHWQKEKLPTSIDLRVICYRIPGFRVQEIVTNQLDPTRLPCEDWVRLTWDCETLTPGLYHRRWEIETTFRELKVEQGLERSLRSRTPAALEFEIGGHMVLYLLTRWLMMEAAVKHGLNPLQLSFVQAQRELLAVRQSLLTAGTTWARVLLRRLLKRIASHRVPERPGRFYPRKKKSTNHRRDRYKKQRVTNKA